MTVDPEVSIALFTRDLRLHDNPVLHAAAASGRVVPLFVVDDTIAGSGFLSPNRAAFLAESLADLDAGLRERGSRLVCRHGDVVAEVCRVAREVGATHVHVASDVSGYAQRRTEVLGSELAADGPELIVHDAAVAAVPAGEVAPSGKDHFAVFTPYFRQWARVAKRRPLPRPRRLSLPDVRPGKLPTARTLCDGQTSPDRATGGERKARQRLAAWAKSVTDYADVHDDLAADGTSRLSPYLHFGCLSPIEVIDRVDATTTGGAAFVRQVAWRDFHHQVLAARPDCSHRDYRDQGDRWRSDPHALQAWKQGRTGYPIVDAGMRQLLREGWMHNRARLIVGSFLTKTLYLDWRLGARHFLDLLVDGDVANNQMNWQWVAGTGTDTRPNRVLNPLAQAKRHDPQGHFVRRYVPELADIESSSLHQPWRLNATTRSALDYPGPIVDLAEGADRFRAARGK